MRRQKGFTLIELLIVVAIIGIIAAIAIPNLLNAINRGRQKRTMSDMRTISTAIGAYGTDNVFYPRAAAAFEELRGYLSPVYIKTFPAKDGWGTPYGFGSDTPGSNYTLVSYGKNREFESLPTGEVKTQDFDCDIVAQNGSFIQYPEGTQVD
ncbi:MAG: prepilin-type N-terminal cleavage/methylation domain-containing protein [Acidobacteria bacterium]|nr:prepilin-type N-terminal cleavage/methylation domain-containing protein [Acidobacteriota bacterium]